VNQVGSPRDYGGHGGAGFGLPSELNGAGLSSEVLESSVFNVEKINGRVFAKVTIFFSNSD
jgi:hypothetical protein